MLFLANNLTFLRHNCTAAATGVTTGWSQATADININFTVESRDTGEYGFLLPEDQIVPTEKELLAEMEVLADHIRSNYKSNTENVN